MSVTCDICNKQRHANDIELWTQLDKSIGGADKWVCIVCADDWREHEMKKKPENFGFIKEKLPILPPHGRGRATGEAVLAFLDLEPNEECITFTDKYLWGNAYRCIGMHCKKNKLKFKVSQRTNPDGIHFHLWKIPMEWKIIDTIGTFQPKKTRTVPRKKTSPRRRANAARKSK